MTHPQIQKKEVLMKIKRAVFPFVFLGLLLLVAGCDSKEPANAEPPVARENNLADGAKDWRGSVGVAVADINGDGHLDIISVSPGAGVKFFENDGKGAFFDRGVIANDNAKDWQGSVGITIADIDGNEVPDIIIGAPGAGIKIIKNPVPQKK